MTKLSPDEQGLKHGYRSGLEGALSEQLSRLGLPVMYEAVSIPWRLEKSCRYTPDFVLPNGIIIESKGRFVTNDRQKHLYIQQQHPELDIRFVFSRSASRISKTSRTTYAVWCSSNDFRYADRVIPRHWIDEPVNEASLAKINQFMAQQKSKGK